MFRIVKFISFIVLCLLSGCSSHPEQKMSEPLHLEHGEVAIDQNFKMFIISDKAIKLQALFFIEIQNTPNARLICSAFYYSPSKFVKDVSQVDIAGTNASFSFDDSNSIIRESERGEEFNFQFPDHKAKCASEPPHYTLDFHQPRLDIYRPGLTKESAIPAKLGISMDLHTLKQIAMQ